MTERALRPDTQFEGRVPKFAWRDGRKYRMVTDSDDDEGGMDGKRLIHVSYTYEEVLDE